MKILYLLFRDSVFKERLFKYKTLKDFEYVKNFEKDNLKNDLFKIRIKNDNYNKIIDLMEIESSDLQEENKLMFEKYEKGNIMKEKLLIYEEDLNKKESNIQNEIESMKKLLENKSFQIDVKIKEESKQEKTIKILKNKYENILKDNVQINQNISKLQLEINQNQNLKIIEQEHLEKVVLTNKLFFDSIASSKNLENQTQSNLKILILEKKNTINDINISHIDFNKMKLQVEIILKNFAFINKYHLKLSELLNNPILNLEKKLEKISKRNNKLELVILLKRKIIQILKELSIIKNYLYYK